MLFIIYIYIYRIQVKFEIKTLYINFEMLISELNDNILILFIVHKQMVINNNE